MYVGEHVGQGYSERLTQYISGQLTGSSHVLLQLLRTSSDALVISVKQPSCYFQNVLRSRREWDVVFSDLSDSGGIIPLGQKPGFLAESEGNRLENSMTLGTSKQ